MATVVYGFSIFLDYTLSLYRPRHLASNDLWPWKSLELPARFMRQVIAHLAASSYFERFRKFEKF